MLSTEINKVFITTSAIGKKVFHMRDRNLIFQHLKHIYVQLFNLFQIIKVNM